MEEVKDMPKYFLLLMGSIWVNTGGLCPGLLPLEHPPFKLPPHTGSEPLSVPPAERSKGSMIMCVTLPNNLVAFSNRTSLCGP